MVWSWEDPGAGSPDRIRELARAAHTAAGDAREVYRTLVDADALDDGAWKGVSGTAFRRQLEATTPEVEELATGYREQARVLSRYADDLAELQAKQQRLAAERAAAADASAGLELELSMASADEALARDPELYASWEKGRDQALWNLTRAQEHESELRARWSQLSGEREDLDREAAQALRSESVLGSLWRFAGNIPAEEMLPLLAGLQTTDLQILLRVHPDLAERVQETDPTKVADWWAGLDSTTRNTLLAGAPALIGNLGGVPYRWRDRANRAWLDQQLFEAQGALLARASAYVPGVGAPDASFENLQTRINALNNIKEALSGRHPGGRSLIGLTDDIPPLAQVAIGDLDEAQNVSFVVPGMNTYTTDMTGWTQVAQNVYNEQRLVASSSSYAVVAWIGYETPPIPVAGGPDLGVVQGAYARAGADNLGADLADFNATTAGRDPVLNVIAHSYGTTTSATALAEQDYGVDAYVMVGSAGIETAVGSASEINAEHVYAAQATNSLPWEAGDPWAWGGRLGSFRDDPVSPTFGATVMGADGEPGTDQHPTTAHDATSGTLDDDAYGYLEPRAECLRNTALATTGQADAITPDQPEPYVPRVAPYAPYSVTVPQLQEGTR